MRQYARQQASTLLRRLAFQVNRAARSAEPEAIHDLRVSIRRLSRCLRVFAPCFPGRSWKKARRDLARLMKPAGRVRDRDITLELLAQCGIPARAAVVRRIEAERREAAGDLVAQLRRWERRDFSHRWRARLEL
jgi:CHAD domain-containing protein